MEKIYDRKETWAKLHGGAPIKCILDVGKNIRFFFDQAMAQVGLTASQSRILGHIHREESKGNSVYQRDIEEVFRIKRSSVTSVLQLLEKKGLILRESVPEDARIKKLTLTDAAREIHVHVDESLVRMEQEIRSLFTEEEFQNFLEYMNRIDQKAMELHYGKEGNDD